jgi:hypothetical protein
MTMIFKRCPRITSTTSCHLHLLGLQYYRIRRCRKGAHGVKNDFLRLSEQSKARTAPR